MPDNRPCPCGSGQSSWWEYDVEGLPLARVCDECIHEKMQGFRPEIRPGYTEKHRGLGGLEYETEHEAGGGLYCPHGMYLGHSYDVICGACEAGVCKHGKEDPECFECHRMCQEHGWPHEAGRCVKCGEDPDPPVAIELIDDYYWEDEGEEGKPNNEDTMREKPINEDMIRRLAETMHDDHDMRLMDEGKVRDLSETYWDEPEFAGPDPEGGDWDDPELPVDGLGEEEPRWQMCTYCGSQNEGLVDACEVCGEQFSRDVPRRDAETGYRNWPNEWEPGQRPLAQRPLGDSRNRRGFLSEDNDIEGDAEVWDAGYKPKKKTSFEGEYGGGNEYYQWEHDDEFVDLSDRAGVLPSQEKAKEKPGSVNVSKEEPGESTEPENNPDGSETGTGSNPTPPTTPKNFKEIDDGMKEKSEPGASKEGPELGESTLAKALAGLTMYEDAPPRDLGEPFLAQDDWEWHEVTGNDELNRDIASRVGVCGGNRPGTRRFGLRFPSRGSKRRWASMVEYDPEKGTMQHGGRYGVHDVEEIPTIMGTETDSTPIPRGPGQGGNFKYRPQFDALHARLRGPKTAECNECKDWGYVGRKRCGCVTETKTKVHRTYDEIPDYVIENLLEGDISREFPSAAKKVRRALGTIVTNCRKVKGGAQAKGQSDYDGYEYSTWTLVQQVLKSLQRFDMQPVAGKTEVRLINMPGFQQFRLAAEAFKEQGMDNSNVLGMLEGAAVALGQEISDLFDAANGGNPQPGFGASENWKRKYPEEGKA